MKLKLSYILLISLSFSIFSCFEDRDDNGTFASEINDFVWKGMNAVYLYKDFVPDLANDRFSSDEEYAAYLNSFDAPEVLFESLIYQRQTVDKFSWIVDDYIALEQQFSGIVKSNGMEYGLRFYPGSNTEVFGYVRYVLPNSDAESKGIQRGDVFTGVDGTPLDINNFASLLAPDTYSIDLADYDGNGTPETSDDVISPNGNSVSLMKEPYTKNPIFIDKVIDLGAEKVGYLMYNGFTADFDAQLNTAFGNFLANNVDHLVVDLRYNPGGSVNTAIILSSLITGQFTGSVHSKEFWNSDLQQQFIDQDPNLLLNFFKDNDEGTPLNSLGLDQVYVLTTGSSASASELTINALNAYIDVVQIGTNTTGKYQASFTLYDSENFGREGANPNHTYAMQPLVLKLANAQDVTDFDDGLVPDIQQAELIADLGILGDVNEPLLKTALDDIQGLRSYISHSIQEDLVGDSEDFNLLGKEMYIDKELPSGIKLDLKQ